MKKYGLIGYPLGHSFSRNFFNQKFQSENIDAEYVNFEIKDIRELKDVVHDHPNLCGLNVTLPYKMAVIPLLDDLTVNARNIGAVNVIKFRRGNFGKLKLIGHNSDITGFKQSIDPLLHESHTKALILGTGGASKAVFHGLKQLGIGATYVSRSKQNSCFTYDELTPRIMEQYTVIVNTTPLGIALESLISLRASTAHIRLSRHIMTLRYTSIYPIANRGSVWRRGTGKTGPRCFLRGGSRSNARHLSGINPVSMRTS